MMRRLFWVGVGVTITVVVVIRGRRLVARYAPAALVDRTSEQARALGERLGAVVTDFKSDFHEARAQREHDLLGSLLAEGQGDLDTLRQRRESHARSRAPVGSAGTLPDDAATPGADAAGGGGAASGAAARGTESAGRMARPEPDDGKRDDIAETLGYSF